MRKSRIDGKSEPEVALKKSYRNKNFSFEVLKAQPVVEVKILNVECHPVLKVN